MRRSKLNAVVRAIREMSWAQRCELMRHLEAAQAAQEADAIVEERMQLLRVCPHCQDIPSSTLDARKLLICRDRHCNPQTTR
jgi:hypothetical protein